MAERAITSRTLSIHETNCNFYVVAHQPFEKGEDGYGWLEFLTVDDDSIRMLPSGRQVFIYPRDAFGDSSLEQEAGIQEHLQYMVNDIGGIAVHGTIAKINLKESS